jgi:hypothetical protein
MPFRVALATCLELPEPDNDEPLLLAELARVGIEAQMAAWDDPGVEWGRFDACVIRSTWDYHLQPDAFRQWVESVSSQTNLLNPPSTVLSNFHKSYLLDLESRGIRIVPTAILSDVHDFIGLEMPMRYVLKPPVSCGSYRTRVFEPSETDAAVGHFLWAVGDSEVMVQPFVPSVDQGGEIAWIWIDGQVTHGIRKTPRFAADDESVSDGFPPTESDHFRLKPILDVIDPSCLYARIDVMEHDEGWLLSELELIEPSLFFMQFPAALERFSAAILKRLQGD